MKTINNVWKTGNKKFEKMTIKVFTAVIGMLLISFAISAQGFCSPLPGNNTSTKMAGSMVDQENGNAVLLASASPIFFANSVETDGKMPIESWMINDYLWGK